MSMRVLLVVLLVAGIGCNLRQKVAGVGAGMSLAGLTLTYSNDARTDEEVGTQGTVGITLLLTGLVVLFVAAALDETAAKEAAAQPQKPRARLAQPRGVSPEIRAMRRREDAWVHTKEAQQVARDGDCARVTELSAKVGSIDAEFYADVFMKDVAIQRCFVPADPTPAPSVPPPIPPIPPTSPDPPPSSQP